MTDNECEAPFAQRIAERMFPGTSATIATTDQASQRASFYVLPSPASARYLLPCRPRELAVTMLHDQMQGPRLRTRTLRVALGAVLQLAPSKLRWPPQLHLVGPGEGAPGLDDWLAERLHVPAVVFAVSLGPPRANRKPVLQVRSPEGDLLAFAKIGHNDLTRRLVQRESEALALLGERSIEPVVAPRRLAFEHWNDLDILLMDPLTRPVRLQAAHWRSQFIRAARAIASVTELRSERWAEHTFHRRMRDRLLAAGSPAPLAAAVHQLASANPSLTYGAWHGDLNPGNLVVGESHVVVWDWERFDRGVPLGFDVLHHDLQQALTVRGTSPAAAASALIEQAPNALAPLAVSPRAARAAAIGYLVWLALRFLEDDQTRAGARLGEVQAWIFPALARAAAADL